MFQDPNSKVVRSIKMYFSYNYIYFTTFRYEGHTTGEFQIECGVDRKDRHVLSGSTDGNVYCWDLIGGTVIKKLNHPASGAVHSLDYHPTGEFLMTALKSDVFLWHQNDET